MKFDYLNSNQLLYSWQSLLLGFAFAAFLVGLGGEFPLLDDWMYSYPIKSLIESGTYELHGEFSPYTFFQVGWAYFLSWIYGEFSFKILRLSVLFFSAAGIYGMFQWIKAVSGNQNIAWLAALLLMFNPLYFNLSFSFMSDVPFAAMMILGFWQYTLFFKNQQKRYRITGAICAILGFLIRQPGIMLFLSAELIIILYNYKKGSIIKNLGILTCLFLSLFLGVELWLKTFLGVKENYINFLDSNTFSLSLDLFIQPVKRYVMSIYYLGFLFLPGLPVVIYISFKKNYYKKSWFGLIVGLNLLFTFLLYQYGRYFPFNGYTIYNFGLGTPFLADFHYWQKHSFPKMPILMVIGLGLFIQIFSWILLKILVEKIYSVWKFKRLRPEYLMIYLFLFFYSGLMFSFTFFDRYVILLFVGIIFSVVISSPEWMKNAKYWLWGVALFAFYSIAGTKDYLSWNQAVLQTKKELLKKGIPREEIDAGGAQNGWDLHDSRQDEAKYIISWGQLDGYKVDQEIKYQRILWGEGILFLNLKE